MRLRQAGTRVTGTYDNVFFGRPGMVEGTVTGTTLIGTWSRTGRSGPLRWTLSADGTTFTGSFQDDERQGSSRSSWCGARPNQPFPDGCSFAGNWQTRVGDRSECPMTLTRINNTVTGTACRGSIDGTVSFLTEGGMYIVLIGTSTSADGRRQLTFYLDARDTYDSFQFQGHLLGDGPHPWCGWRAGGRPPEPCYLP